MDPEPPGQGPDGAGDMKNRWPLLGLTICIFVGGWTAAALAYVAMHFLGLAR